MSEKTRFTPIKGTEEHIFANFPGYNEGYLYFATDTKKIFLDSGGKSKIPMGSATSGIYYGVRPITEDEQTSSRIIFQVSDDPEVSQIEGSEMPNLDDLVLNSPDGCFYRVTQIIDASQFEATRLTVAGSGGSGPAGEIVNLELTISGVQTGQVFVHGQSQNMVFRGNVDNGDTKIIYQVDVTNTYAGSTTSKTYGPFSNNVGADYTFDIGSVLPLGTNSIEVSATSDNAGKVIKKKFTLINCVEMYLGEVEFNPLVVQDGNITLPCLPIGVDLTKTVSVYVDDVLIPSLTRTNIILSGQGFNFNIPAQTHGMHTIRLVLSCAESAATYSVEYNVCCIDLAVTAPVIWVNTNTPTTIVNHDPLNIEYMVYNPLSTNNAETHFYINGTEIPTSPLSVAYTSGGWLKWRVVGYEVGSQVFTIRVGTTSMTIPVEILPDTKRNLDIVETGLYVNLAAAGRSNRENAQSRSVWSYRSSLFQTTTEVQFNNFNWYNNGWITDDDGETCLRVSNGASIEIPLSLMKTKNLQESLSFEFVFKVRNVQNYSTLINTIVEDPDSENPIIKKEVSSTDGVWGSYYNNNIGFCLGTQETFFKTKNALVSGRYKEDELVHVTFVVEAQGATGASNALIYIYINGVNSGITKYNLSTDSLQANCPAIQINSEYCDVDIYNIRVYRTNLTAQYVVQNYLADYNDAELYDMNVDIVDYKNGIPSINFTKMLEYNSTHPDSLLMPYMVIETTDAEDTLPYKKNNGDGWVVNIDFVNPTLDYEYEHDLWTQKDLDDRGFKSKEEMYLHSCPSYHAVGADLNVQGTSSQGYPIRNYKAKFKGCSSWVYTNGPLAGISILKGGTTDSGMKVPKKWFMDSWVGENKTTLKADYMDSSGVHNTGFASFVRTLYTKHPLDDYADALPEGVDSSKLRTSVYGFPIMMFHKSHTGEYKFLGRYNYNLDKGCDDTFGFCDWGDDSYIDVTSLVNAENFDNSKLYVYNAETEEYEALDAEAEYDNSATYFRKDSGADSLAVNPDYDATDPYSRHYLPWSEAAECWEFRNNQGGRCSLKKADFEETNAAGALTVVNDFEYRYHVDADSFDNAYAGVNEARKPKGKIFATQEELNSWVLKKMARYERLVDWIASTDTIAATNEPLETPVTYNDVQYTNDTAEYRLAKFSNEFNQHLDKEYCLVYYIMTELLICYDSRGKNLMLATWGPKVRGGEDIWYPIFYDIDTQLGVNNAGVPYWDYYEECSRNGTFSTPDSVLWNNLWTCFESEIRNKYDDLTGSKLTIPNLNGYYNFNPEVSKSRAMAGHRPIIIHDVDEYQKYIAPSTTGYRDTSNTLVTSDAYYYCLQGSRELQRALFLRNRFNYLGSQWQSGPYSYTSAVQGISTRFDANDYPNTSDKYIGRDLTAEEITDGYEKATPETNPLDSTANYFITPYLKQYISYWYDTTKSTTTYASDGETIEVAMLPNKLDDIYNKPHHTQQLVYWGGPEYISSLGDLSRKYLDQFWIQSAKRLKDIILGNDTPGYKNTMINKDSFRPDDAATITVGDQTKSNPNAKTLLEKVILTNLTGLTDTLDFSGSEKLKELRALNTNVSSFTLADGVQIAKLYLPEATTNLILKEPTSLTGILTDPSPSQETVIEFKPISVTAATYDPSIHYVNTIDGYKRCDDTEYFGYRYESIILTEETFDNRDFTIYIYNSQDDEYREVTSTASFDRTATYFQRFDDVAYNESRSYYIRIVETELVYPDGLYIEGLTNLTTINDESRTHLDTIDIIGGNMGYDSYTLLNKTVQIKNKMIVNENLNTAYDKHLAINLEKVDWTPYRLVEYGEYAEDDAIYVLLSDHDILEDYSKVNGEYPNWELNTLNGKVYEFVASKLSGHENDIVDLEMLDTFIDDYNLAMEDYTYHLNRGRPDDYDPGTHNFFKNTDGYAKRPTLARLTGIVYVNNPANRAIDEALIKNKYNNEEYYIDLTIHAANIIKANVVKFIEIVNDETGQEKVWDVLKYSVLDDNPREYPELTTVQGSKLNYDFRGWSRDYYTQEALDRMDEYQIEDILLDDNSVQDLLFANATDKVIKLYAVYTIHSYHFTFMNSDNTVIQEVDVPTDEYIPMPSTIPYQDDSALDLLETYQFIGYSRIKGGGEADVIALNPSDPNKLNIKSSQDLVLYATYKTLNDVHANVLDSKYLDINPDGYVSVKAGFTLNGKIVLPNAINGTTVKGIGYRGFYDQRGITHIFLENALTSELERIDQEGVAASSQGISSLIYFEMPKHTKVSIGLRGFYNCEYFLKNINQELTREFFYAIKDIANQGFQGIDFGFTNGIYIGPAMTRIGENAFYDSDSIISITIGSSGNRISADQISFTNTANGSAASEIFNTPWGADDSNIENVTIYTTSGDEYRWREIVATAFGIPRSFNLNVITE